MSEGEQHGDRKIINWQDYNRALVNRGSLTFWFDEDIQSVWFHKSIDGLLLTIATFTESLRPHRYQ